MDDTTYLLIGGGLAASRAARALGRAHEGASIILVGEEPHVPYDRPPLSKEFLRGEIPREKLAYDSPEDLEGRGVSVLLGDPVTRLDPEAQEVILGDGRRLRFARALLATGGRPVRLDIPGADLRGVHYLRTVDDAAALRREVAGGARVVIVGAGFIGMEAAASLTQGEAQVTVVETASHVWARFLDPTLGDFFQTYCGRRGVTFLTGDTVTALEGDERVRQVALRSGERVSADVVLIAVGIEPNVELARDAGLDLDDGVLVDAQLRTSHPAVYAAGDAARFPDPVFGRRRRVEHWGHADYSGTLAGRNMAGGEDTYDLLSYVWSDIFDLHLEFAGDEETHDRTLVRGDIGEDGFTVLYLKDDRLTAYFSVNGNPREYAPLKKLIRRQVDLGGRDAELQDPETSLRDLAARPG